MEVDKIVICRLCFDICKSGFKIIEDSTKETLNFLLLNLNFEISNEPVTCNNCIDSLKECFNFKRNYLCKRDTSKCIKHEDVGLNTLEVHLIDNKMDTPEMHNNSGICSSCKKPINHETSLALMNEEEDVTGMLEIFFPEVTLNDTANAMCKACYKALQEQLTFISKCLTVEGNIKEYCKTEGTNNKGQVELGNVLHFVSKNQLQNNIHSSFNAVKVEEDSAETEKDDKTKIKKEDLLEIDELGICSIEKEDIDIKMEQDEDDRIDVFQTTEESFTDIYLPTQTDTAEELPFRCNMCLYKTKQKHNFVSHLLNHRHPSTVKMYMCEICSHQTRHKYSLSKHMLIHKDPSEAIAYKCELCTYECRQKYRLSEHMTTHKDSSEVVMYKCELCTYQSKRKYNLSRHILGHDQPSEVTVYKCKICPYESKHRYRLSEHMVSHKDPSEVVEYKCKICTYQTVHEHKLSKHMLIHMDSSKAVMYMCEICSYQTRYKRALSEHVLTHKDPSEVIMYKCEMCRYQSKRKRDLSRHVLIHKTIS